MPDTATSPDPEAEAQLLEDTRLALGRRIRSLRMERGISGRSLAKAIGVTSGFISQVELGAATPSVATLVKLAATLEIQVADFFEGQREPGRLLRLDERTYHEYTGLGVRESFLCREPNLTVVHVKLEPGGTTGEELFVHGSDVEFIVVQKGAVTMMVGSEEYVLRTGDALHFGGQLPHGCRNDGRGQAEILWAVTPSTY